MAMQVSSALKGDPLFRADRDVSSSRAEKNGQAFAADLNRNKVAMSTEQLNLLMEKINEQGEKLTKTPTFTELKTYRDLVRKFVGEAVGQMYDVESKTGWDRRGRQKASTVVRKIDKHLEELTEDVRVGQDRQLEIMSKLGAIKGMLLDLYM